MPDFLTLARDLAVYLVANRLIMRCLNGGRRELAMLLLNLAAVFIFLFYFNHPGRLRPLIIGFAFYFMVVVFQYMMLRTFSLAGSKLVWVAFLTPIAILAAYRYIPEQFVITVGHMFKANLPGRPNLIGISYLAFRCSRLVFEVRNGAVPLPGLCQYLNFSFFLPTMSVGPINTYANFRAGFASVPWHVPAGRAALRIIIGFVKYEFLSGILNRLTYSAFLLDGHQHLWVDLPIVMVFYYLYLYCNFSGFCDMAVGAAALIGIPVPENFDNPFAARNIKDFWNRWHITLSQWMRDIVFAPLSKALVRLFGPAKANHAIALTIIVVFLLVGIWHGVGWNYAIYGFIHAMGLVANHYYTIGLKKWLGREGFKAYNANRWIHAAAVMLTFAYCAASPMFFANTLPQIREIFQTLR